MEYITELKADNKQLEPIITDCVTEAFGLGDSYGQTALRYDKEILLDYLRKPGRGVGGSLLLRFSKLFEAGDYSEASLKFAAAMEIVNAHLLIIDDWVDSSDTRKRQPTLHESYREVFEDTEGVSREHFAASQAVQLGLLALQSAHILMNSPELVTYQNVRKNIHTGLFSVTKGIMLEPLIAQGSADQSEQGIISIYTDKASNYSFVTPMVSGLQLAGASGQIINSFKEAMIPVGLAFQFQDDLMGIFGNPEKTGKPNVDDIREGLYTILVHRAKEMLSEKEYNELLAMHGKPVIEEAMLARYQEILDTGGIRTAVEKEAQSYLEQASEGFETLWSREWNEELLLYLRSLTKFLHEKKY